MISDKADKMTDFLVGACVAFGQRRTPDYQEKIGEALTELHDYIASLEAENAALHERTRWIPRRRYSDGKLIIKGMSVPEAPKEDE